MQHRCNSLSWFEARNVAYALVYVLHNRCNVLPLLVQRKYCSRVGKQDKLHVLPLATVLSAILVGCGAEPIVFQ